MLFSILLPTLGLRVHEMDRLLQSLNRQEIQDYEVVIVTQIHHKETEELIRNWKHIKIKHIKLENKGLSLARNAGLKECEGEWVILSDDDCWYPKHSLKVLKRAIDKTKADILLTQIYDPERKEPYKAYAKKGYLIKNKFQLLSKSSIEIAVKKNVICKEFDEDFGLGAEYVCGEEIDFLLNHFHGNRIVYVPIVTVCHLKKENADSGRQIVAKGALYAKHFNRCIGSMVLLRDYLLKREKNWKEFWQGFNSKRTDNRRRQFGVIRK